MVEYVKGSLIKARTALEELISNDETLRIIYKAGLYLSDVLKHKGTIFSCGNGGSFCDSMHFAEELSGRYRKDRHPLAALAICDPGHITCTANDFGYDEIFARFLEAHGKKSDALLAISTSGKSPNILKAVKQAHSMGMRVVALTGRQECKLGDMADYHICTPGGTYADRVQELHIKVIHILVEIIERELFPDNYL